MAQKAETPKTPEPSASQSTSAALRMRRHRARRQQGLFCLALEVRQTEIDTLIRRGLLSSETRNIPHAIKQAFYAFLDRTLR